MQLYKKDSIKYDDGSVRNFYQFEALKNCNELKKLILSLQNKFGMIDEIIVRSEKTDNAQDIVFYKKYENLADFIKNYNLQDIQEFNMYVFTGNNVYYHLNTLSNTLAIYKENIIAEDMIEEEPNYEYYKFENDLILRFDLNSAKCYYLTNDGNWKYDNSFRHFIDDPAYKYEIIDDPLSEKKNKR